MHPKDVRMRTTVALVDDHKLFREGMRALLASQTDLQVVAEAGSAEEAVSAINASSPDVVILDLLLPGRSGMMLARELLRQEPKRRLMALSMLSDESDVAAALDAGFLGYASKEQSVDEVIAGIRAVAKRQPYLAPRFSQLVLDEYRRLRREKGEGSTPLAALTQREREIFDLTVSGLNTAGIARQLFISKRTVETHRARILRKLNMHSASDLVRLAAKLGLLPL
jgi:two-component system NarL family response regulator/two-component system response regulator DegU